MSFTKWMKKRELNETVTISDPRKTNPVSFQPSQDSHEEFGEFLLQVNAVLSRLDLSTDKKGLGYEINRLINKIQYMKDKIDKGSSRNKELFDFFGEINFVLSRLDLSTDKKGLGYEINRLINKIQYMKDKIQQ